MMIERIAPSLLKSWLHDGQEVALLDVREHGQYGEAHLFYATPLPYSRLELDVRRLVPRRDVRVVVYDDGGAPGDGVAWRAADRLAALGYHRVGVLDGGAPGWQAAGYVLFAGVNLPSKTFGELAEHTYGTPRVSAPQLAAMIAGPAPVVVLDGNTGSAKTDVLNLLPGLGVQVIDLEGLARHRGSLFGAMGEQPSQKALQS